MSTRTDTTEKEQEFRKKTDNGQVTIPLDKRGEEDGYLVEETDEGILLIPAVKNEEITIVQANK